MELYSIWTYMVYGPIFSMWTYIWTYIVYGPMFKLPQIHKFQLVVYSFCWLNR